MYVFLIMSQHPHLCITSFRMDNLIFSFLEQRRPTHGSVYGHTLVARRKGLVFAIRLTFVDPLPLVNENWISRFTFKIQKEEKF